MGLVDALGHLFEHQIVPSQHIFQTSLFQNSVNFLSVIIVIG